MCQNGLCPITVDLTKFACQDLTLGVVNQANDWPYEFGYWGAACVGMKAHHSLFLNNESCSMTVAYAFEPNLSAEEFIDVLTRSTLAERRPVNDRTAIERMLRIL